MKKRNWMLVADLILTFILERRELKAQEKLKEKNRQLKIQHGRWRNGDVKELEVMLSGMPEEQKQRIRDKADRLEAYFKDDVLYMKDKDEEWCDGMLPKETKNKGSK